MPNAERDGGSGSFPVATVITYRCREGTRLKGIADLTCQSDESWDTETHICKCEGKVFHICYFTLLEIVSLRLLPANDVSGKVNFLQGSVCLSVTLQVGGVSLTETLLYREATGQRPP